MIISNNFFFFLSIARDTNFLTKCFINYRCGERLLVNKKLMLVVGLNEN